jgi:hypothetical protein
LHPSVDSIDQLLEGQTYLNFSGQFQLKFVVPRLRGPNLHPISFAYELSFCTLICFMYRYRILASACFIMLFFVGAKGAIVLTMAALLFYALYAVTRRRRFVLLCLVGIVASYIAIGVYYGLASEDYHILGLLGSLHGFLSNPLGHGVGVGGNLSSQGYIESTEQDFQHYQHQGFSDVALESGFGVMLYQLGMMSLLFLEFYWGVVKSVSNTSTAPEGDKRAIVLPVALIFVLVNSVFQEEAFSPACLGLWMLYAGFFIAQRWKEGLVAISSG